MPAPASIDDYLATLPAPQRAALAKLRRAIRAAAPRAEECISYQRPAFRQDGVLVAFGATAKHCAFHPMSSATIAEHADELADYDTSTGTIRFAPDDPLPAALVGKLVRARLAENAARKKGSPARTRPVAKTPKAANDPKSSKAGTAGATHDVRAVVAAIEALATQKDHDNLARFGIVAPKAFGVSMANLKVLAKRYGKSHELAAALWETGWYEARMLACLVEEPARVTPAQMDRWCRDFDNWGICDTACFTLFDRTPHAWGRIAKWRGERGEFQKRAAFALMASLALHDKKGADEPYLAGLGWIAEASDDERNFVKKGVNWALRAVGRRGPALAAAAVAVARELAASKDATPRWIGKDALRDLAKFAARPKRGSARKVARATRDRKDRAP